MIYWFINDNDMLKKYNIINLWSLVSKARIIVTMVFFFFCLELEVDSCGRSYSHISILFLGFDDLGQCLKFLLVIGLEQSWRLFCVSQ